jgi:CrcB protein
VAVSHRAQRAGAAARIAVAFGRPMNAVSFPMIWAIALGGAAGTVSRYAISQWMLRAHGAFPLATFAINIAGSFLIALFARVMSTPDSSPVLRAALTIGFCGGFTTFSTFSAEFVTLVQEGRTGRAVLRPWPVC